MLPLPIIIPEHDLKYPVINIDLAVDTMTMETSSAPLTEPDAPESSVCSFSQSASMSTTQQDTELDDDGDEDSEDGDEEDDEDGDPSQQSKKKSWSTQI